MLAERLEPRIVLDSTTVFNELMYHPADEQTPEWIELYNQNSLNMDLSGWSLADGIQYTFPMGTVLQGGDFLVVASDPEAMKAATGFDSALGPFTGRLSNGGERIELRNHNDRVMDEIDYDDKGQWPVGPDGSGVTLAKQNQHTATGDPASWTASAEIGGTPGAPNFLEPGTFVFEDLLPVGATARAIVPLDNNLKLDWIEPGFDDSSWTLGTTGVGYDLRTDYDKLLGLDLEAPPEGQPPIPMNNVNQTLYVRIPFEIDTDLDRFDTLTLRMKYDDGFVAYLNGVEIAHANAPGRDGDNRPLSWFSGSTRSNSNRRAVVFEDFDITQHRDLLVQGENVLAIHGLNNSVGGSRGDLLLLPELVGGTEVKPDTRLAISFSEVMAAGDDFWVELSNAGDQPIDVSGFVIAGTGLQGGEHVLPASEIMPGGLLVVSSAELGFQAAIGESLFLYAPDKQSLPDAVSVTERLQARSERHDGRWMHPSNATPGQPNEFQFHDQIVINEIMYHAAPQYATPDTPPTYEPTSLISFDATWRYNQSGQNLGQNWQRSTHAADNITWFEGQGVFSSETRERDEPINTELPRPRREKREFVTYYFQTEFEVSQNLDDVDLLQLNYLVDDGAILFLNGQEVQRVNLPRGTVTAATGASSAVRRPTVAGPVSISTELLEPGRNVLSAEVHVVLEGRGSPDVVFGVELISSKETSPGISGSPFAESDEEWIELYNRSQTETVDLSGWSVDDAVEFTIPEGTTIEPGQYVVISNDPEALATKHADTLLAGSVLGPFERSLSNSSERIVLLDANTNIADEVQYYDGGRWHQYADGGGSSLELRDPFADNTKAEAWAASDESGVLGRSPWQHFSYTRTVAKQVFDASPLRFNEFHMGMLDAGEVLLDNLSVIEDPGGDNVELLQNGDFEADEVGGGADAWRFDGSHEDTRVTADPDNANNKVLHLIAEARANYFGNHAETTLANGAEVEDGKAYQISFDAKWIAGSPQLHTELYYKDAARTTILPLPVRSGTPGAQNSVFESNIGPTYSDLTHSPVVPKENQPVTVSVLADDPHGVSSMTLVWSVDGGEFSRTEMTGGSGGSYQATIPPQQDDGIVQFYVEGTDGNGAVSLYPAAGPDSRALYKVLDDFKPDPMRHDVQIIMLPDEARNLHATTEYIDNDRTGSTFIYRGREVFYDIGARLKGSMFSRNSSDRAGFNVRFHPDQPFRGVHDKITFDRANKQEIQVKHLINQAGLLGGMYDDVVNLRTPLGPGDGPTPMQMARHEPIYLDSQFENGSEGTVYKFEGIRVMTNTVDNRPESAKIYQPIGWVSSFDIADLGDDKEDYRWPFLITNNRAKDDFTRMIDLAKAFSLDGPELTEALAEVIDIDQWMQTFAMMSLAGIGDTYSQGNPHNLSFYQRPSDNKMLAFPWDWDFTFNQSARAPLHGNKKIGQIIDIPEYSRIFSGHMINMINTVFNEDYMSDWVDHFGQMLGSSAGFSAATSKRFIRDRGEFVLSRLLEGEPFEIASNGGANFTTTRPTIVLEGRGWVSVQEIRMAGQEQPLPITLSGVDGWQIDVPLNSGPNTIALEAYDAQGSLLGSDELVVTYIADAAVGDVFISEVHYNNNLLSSGSEAEDFEFVELYNKSDSPVDISNWQLSGDVSYVFPAGSSIAPREAAAIFPFESNDLVKKFSLELLFSTDTRSVKLFGPYTGQLGDEGGTIRLERPLAEPPANDPNAISFALVDEVIYDDVPPWPVNADGLGSSLTRQSSIALGSVATAWTASQPSPGQAEFPDRQRGDSNADGTFDQLDIVQVLQSAKYLSGTPATFEEGDWNEDGLFDQRDIVTVLQDGSFNPRSNAAQHAQLVDEVFAGS